MNPQELCAASSGRDADAQGSQCSSRNDKVDNLTKEMGFVFSRKLEMERDMIKSPRTSETTVIN